MSFLQETVIKAGAGEARRGRRGREGEMVKGEERRGGGAEGKRGGGRGGEAKREGAGKERGR